MCNCLTSPKANPMRAPKVAVDLVATLWYHMVVHIVLDWGGSNIWYIYIPGKEIKKNVIYSIQTLLKKFLLELYLSLQDDETSIASLEGQLSVFWM